MIFFYKLANNKNSNFTLVHVVDSLGVASTQADSLSDDVFVAPVARDDGFLVILRKGSIVVVHDRIQIVGGSEIAELCGVDLVKVTDGIPVYIRPLYFNELVAFCMRVHVVVSESCFGC